MDERYTRERDLQGQFTELLSSTMPEIEVVDVQLDLVAETVCLFVDQLGGVDLAVCASVTRAVRDICPELVLEVSSPGIERPLRLPEQFLAHLGAPIRLRRRGHKNPIKATVSAANEQSVTFTREHDGATIDVEYPEIIRCHVRVIEPSAGEDPRAAKTGRTA